MTTRDRWKELERMALLHGSLALPDKPSAMAMTLVGRRRETMVFRTPQGHLLVFTFKEGPRYREKIEGTNQYREVGARYLLSDEALANYTVSVRVLYPDKTSENIVYDQLVNHEWKKFSAFEAREYQLEGVDKVDENLIRLKKYLDHDPGLTAEDMPQLEGTIGLPTGSGKTLVMMGAMVDVLRLGLWKEGDKFILATHLKTITKQNVEAVSTQFGPLFKQITGRDLNVSVYGGDQSDLSGDVVIASIPKVNMRQGEEDNFFSLLGSQLESFQGQVSLLLIDEVHHLTTAESWQDFKQGIQTLSPNTYTLGVTATLTGEEPNVLYTRKPLEMMRLGASPNVHVMEVPTGESLDTLAPKTKGADFNVSKMSGQINNDRLNRKLVQTMEEQGIRSPDGRQLAAGLVFGLDTDHLLGMAGGYARYFGMRAGDEAGLRTRYQKAYPLRARKIEIVGVVTDTKGKQKIQSAEEIRSAIERKQRGEVDTLIAVYTGKLSDEAREIIEEAWANQDNQLATIKSTASTASEMGRLHPALPVKGALPTPIIETVFADEALAEGKDLPWVQNAFFNDPTLSDMKRAQRAGRITRYMPGEIDHATGRLLQMRPRLAVEIIYSLHRHGSQLNTVSAFGNPPLSNTFATIQRAGRLAVGNVVFRAL